ncbi:efflux RND transporter periplasmic adaptor subunit [Collimonas sp.]|uniref:efflux RND transporter periplasmic adaptor subunit n=1 Tax=Collimonas sp. TaxID=1963772 RepID=UPI002C1EC04F|nr:efflux RND transporter periplasmic adaptor subunit [Collimonas sp.]HWW99972.1 efflux RND transporter periplasmic adaptor subunit [Collimonas sp.]
MLPKKTLLTLTLTPLLAVAMLGACSRSADAPAPKAVAEVGIVTVKPEPQSVSTELPGRTVAYLTADIRPQIGGIIQRRLFTEGADVKQGQALYQIDPATYQAAADSARASLAKAEATLRASKLKAERYVELNKIDAVSKQDNDDAQSVLSENQAALEVARAALKTAAINLEFTRITAPISGRIETSTVTPGALVVAQQNVALTTIQKIDPIYVDVTQSSVDVLRMRRELSSGNIKAVGRDEAPVRLVLEDGSVYAQPGKLKFTGLSVNTGTGMITLRAEFPNPDGLLLPGMYVRAQLEEAVDQSAILVPQKAVTRDALGAATALILNDAGKVERRALTVGRAIGNRWWVNDGLKAGDQVIVDGLQKIKIGDSVRAVDMSAAPLKAVPQPVTSPQISAR